MLPRFTLVHRSRPVRLVAAERRTGFVAPSLAVEVEVPHQLAGRVAPGVAGPDGLRLSGWYDGGSRLAGLEVTRPGGRTTRHRSRRHGRAPAPPEAVAATLTGRQLSVLTRAEGRWTVRGRVEVGDVDPGGLTAGCGWAPRDEGLPAPAWRSGTFGQLGVRDLQVVTHADGSPVRDGDRLLLTVTHAGPGFFDTAHTGVWSFDPDTCALEHRADLWFRRDGVVRGDHATHLVRDGDRWLVATSTWGDFDGRAVGITVATTSADLLRGEHVLDPEPLPLPVEAVGVWDPHLTLIDGHWHLAFVAASRFFVFHPVLARARQPGRLADWEVLGAAPDRVATEGVGLVRLEGAWRVLASDGRDNPPGIGGRFPVFDLAMREVGTLEAPYPSNIPWPSLVEHRDGWLVATFDGTPYGGEVAGYGTHGDFLVLRTT